MHYGVNVMGEHYIDNAKLIEQLLKFSAFVSYIDNEVGKLSFRDSTSFLGKNEGYKTLIAEEARKELNNANWNESWIGSGRIAECVKNAMNKSTNLVNMNQQVDFKNRLDPTHPNFRPGAERVLYNIYSNQTYNESQAFEDAIEVFGAKYDTIAFLFFIKDDTRFLPISTGHFDKAFDLLNIDYRTSRRCCWDNYQGYLEIIKEIYDVMNDVLSIKGVLRFVDAHSFLWIIQQDRFIDWKEETKDESQIEMHTEEYIQKLVQGSGGCRKIQSNTYVRSAGVIKESKKRAHRVCQLCKNKAPFVDKKGEPYLEVHHVKWLSQGGEDSTSNTVALCPNCHTRVHVLNTIEDDDKLKSIINLY